MKFNIIRWEFVPWIFFGLCVGLISLVVPMSLTKDKINIVTDCANPNPRFSFNTSSNYNLNEFIAFSKRINHSLKMLLTLPSDYEKNPPEWNSAFIDLKNRGVKVQLITNAPSFSAPDNVEILVFPKAEIRFHANLALGDNQNILMPSSFFSPAKGQQAISYLFKLDTCRSASNDLSNLFDMMWHTPKKDRNVAIKKKWVSSLGFQNKHGNLQFTLDPKELYPVMRQNTSDAILYALDSMSTQNFVFTSQMFPYDLNKSFTNSFMASIIAGFFEIPQYGEIYSQIIVPYNEYLRNLNHYRAILINFNGGSRKLFTINSTFDATIVGSSTSTVLFPAGLSEAFVSNSLILGINYRTVTPSIFKDLISTEYILNNVTCPNITINKL